MRSYLPALLLLALTAQTVLIAQKTTPTPPPSPAPSGGPSPIPIQGLDVYSHSLQRVIDDERMNTPEPPTNPVTIVEFGKTLAENRSASDAKLAAILSGFALTERANGARLSRWSTAFTGQKTRQVFVALADGSAFLPLPAEDIPATEPPSVVEQRRMVATFAKFLGETLPGLPNFRATRLTTYFEDRPPRQLSLSTDPGAADTLRNRPLHVVGTGRLKVAYVEGHEDTERNIGFDDANLYASRFTTAGEFGPILYGVMMDATQSKLAWARWESSADGPLAVFHFEAPKGKSHYSIKPPGSGNAQKQFVAYLGEIALHPSDGAVAWLSVVARPAPEDAMAEANIAVEYGRVEIGQRVYTCPVHGVALSKVPLVAARTAKQNLPVPLQTQLNDVSFQQYHVFRGDLHIAQDSKAQP